MEISKFKIAWKWLTGGIGSVVDYLLEIVNSALDKIDPDNKKKITAALNTTIKVMSVMKAIAFLVPTKWQSAYNLTLQAVVNTVLCLDDLSISAIELDGIRNSFTEAVNAWKSDDDDTCTTFSDCESCMEE